MSSNASGQHLGKNYNVESVLSPEVASHVSPGCSVLGQEIQVKLNSPMVEHTRVEQSLLSRSLTTLYAKVG